MSFQENLKSLGSFGQAGRDKKITA